MKNKHEQLYVAVQDLLIELGITPKRLMDIAANKTHNSINPKTARKLIDADLIVEEINWKMPKNIFDPHQEDNSSVVVKDEDLSRQLKSFANKINVSGPHQKVNEEEQVERIKESVLSNDLYLFTDDAAFLRLNKRKYCEVLATFDKIKSDLTPLSLWSYLREKHPKFLSVKIFEQIKGYLFPSG